jgi:hypothetical protein
MTERDNEIQRIGKLLGIDVFGKYDAQMIPLNIFNIRKVLQLAYDHGYDAGVIAGQSSRVNGDGETFAEYAARQNAVKPETPVTTRLEYAGTDADGMAIYHPVPVDAKA